MSSFWNRYQKALSEFLIDCVIPSVTVREKVDLGTAETSIVQLAQSEGYDLIVMSTHGKSGLRMSLGSVLRVSCKPPHVLFFLLVRKRRRNEMRAERMNRSCISSRLMGR
jgi:hypothetical protein